MFLDMRKEFTEALKEQQQTFEKTLEKISTDFVAQIRNSEERHKRHDKKLDEIINKIK
jgi:succinate dehydrogenase flavin-adding protein (antitoxin of CptAB toxin-antitoxin module)